jgi:hypothetical protein
MHARPLQLRSSVLTARAQDDRTLLLREADAARAARRRRPSCPVWQLASPVFDSPPSSPPMQSPARDESSRFRARAPAPPHACMALVLCLLSRPGAVGAQMCALPCAPGEARKCYCRRNEGGPHGGGGQTCSRRCVACPFGQYEGSGTQSSCAECGAGHTVNSVISATTCTACGAGRSHTTPIGSTVCGACGAGFYHPHDAASGSLARNDCIACGDGYYGLATGQTKRTSACPFSACPVGTYSPASGGACYVCPPGHFTTNFSSDNDGEGVRMGASHCNPCPASMFNNESDSACHTCDTGNYSGQGAKWCSSACPDRPSQRGRPVAAALCLCWQASKTATFRPKIAHQPENQICHF